MNSDHIIEMRDVDFSYGETTVLKDVNLAVQRGDFIGVVGPNGGGKTTLLRLLLGLITPDRGSIKIFGSSPADVKDKVGYMPQNVDHDFSFPITVRDVVLMGRLNTSHIIGPYRRKDRKAVEKALQEVDMYDFIDKPFSDLSGGQRQRILIARSIVAGPELILLDEPTSNIDIEAERNFFELLKDLNRKMTVMVVSHDLGFASKYIKRIVCVNRKVHEHPTEGLDEEDIKEIYGMEMQLIRHEHVEDREGS